jgi:putative hydrolase of HD superfamily
MPVLLNLANGGGSWVENGIVYERVIRKVGPPIEAGCPALWAWLAPQLEDARNRGFFAD